MNNNLLNVNDMVARHEDQKWGDYPYRTHLSNVAINAARLNRMLPVEQQFSESVVESVAYAHDLLEDTDTNPDELDENIRDAVVSVSRNLSQRDFSYQEYIVSIASSGNQLAVLVKLADALANYNLSVMNGNSIVSRYRKSVPVLFEALFQEEWDNERYNMFSLVLD